MLYARRGHAPRAGRNRRRDRVAHEREVARLFSVAIQRDRLIGQRRTNETIERHVRTLPRAVHREIAHGRRRNPVIHDVQVTQLLGRQLGDAIRGDRLRKRIFPHRDADVVAVHRRTRRVNETLERAADARLEQPLRRVDVVVGVDAEVASPALAHARLRREMKHVRLALQQRRQIGVLDAALDEPEALPAGIDGEVALLDLARVVVGEAVEACDLARHRPADDFVRCDPMKPAAPVISALMRTPRGRERGAGTAGRSRRARRASSTLMRRSRHRLASPRTGTPCEQVTAAVRAS